MAPRARLAFLAFLALIALQVTLPGGSTTAETGSGAWGASAEAWAKATYKLPPTATGARAHPGDGTLGRFPHTPFAAAAFVGIGFRSTGVGAPASRSEDRAAEALVALPRSRAPPTLS